MDQEDIAAKNVEQLNFTARALKRMAKPLPGSRPDGGIAKPDTTMHDMLQHIAQRESELLNDLQDAKNLVENLEHDLLQLETTLIEVREQLEREKNAREHFENMLRQIATLVVNGSKAAPQ